MEDHEHDYARRPKYLIVPQRFVITLLGLSGLIIVIMPIQADEICYAHVVSSHDNSKTSQEDVNICNTTELSSYKIVPIAPGKFPWTDERIPRVRTANRWAYWLATIPAGLIGDKFGARPTLGISVFVVCSATLLRAFYLERTNGELIFVYVIGAVAGTAERVAHTGGFCLMSHWIPRREFGRICGVFLFYNYLPIVINELCTDRIIVSTRSWAAPLYICGVLGILWCVAWFFFGFSTYRDCPYISQKEFDYLEQELAPHLNFGKRYLPPLKLMAKSTPFWSLLIAHVGEEMATYVLQLEFNKFLYVLHGRDPTRPYFLVINLGVIIFTPLFGAISDHMVNRGYVHVTLARKIFGTFGSMGPAIFTLTAAHTGCAVHSAAILSILAQVLGSTYNIGIPLNIFDHAPNFIGFLYSLDGGIAAVVSYVAPSVFGAFKYNTHLPLRTAYMFVFWSSFACTSLAYVVYMMIASGEVQPWNHPDIAKMLENEAKESKQKQDEDTVSL